MIHFQLVTLTGTKFDDDVAEVILPTLEGQIAVLKDHMPLISAATAGVISVRRSPKDPDYVMEHFATFGGVIEMANNVLRVLVDEADHGEELNEAEVQKALERARQMKAEAKDQTSLEHAQALVDRTAIRLHVAQLHHRAQRSRRS
ncbi:MAG TPA: ATP synthase F1 subunit epsilon [Candidatus Saccharimonadales bacterium]|nr:ATP synthase F1 subunit epsilon [Candidatus Saccharimonadales bacterium]